MANEKQKELAKVIEKYFGADAGYLDISCIDLARVIIEAGWEKPVRCKDCKHKTVTSDGMVCECALPTKRMQDYYIYGSTILARVEPDALCSHGERRSDETNNL